MSSSQYPFHIRLKGIEESFEGGKSYGFLATPDVTMIPFAALVVISEHTFSIHDERKPALNGWALPGGGYYPTYPGNCQYEWQRDARGNRCGRRSASSKPGGW